MLYGGTKGNEIYYQKLQQDDYLIGGPGNDYLSGQGGNDKLEDTSGELNVFVDVDGGDEWIRGNNKGMAVFILDTTGAHCWKCPKTTIDKVLKGDEFMFD